MAALPILSFLAKGTLVSATAGAVAFGATSLFQNRGRIIAAGKRAFNTVKNAGRTAFNRVKAGATKQFNRFLDALPPSREFLKKKLELEKKMANFEGVLPVARITENVPMTKIATHFKFKELAERASTQATQLP